jgi:hypothetical protein
MYKILQLAKNNSTRIDALLTMRGQWKAGGGGSKSNNGGRQRWLTTTGGVGQRWSGEDGGSGRLGVAVAAMAAAVAVGGGIFYAL